MSIFGVCNSEIRTAMNLKCDKITPASTAQLHLHVPMMPLPLLAYLEPQFAA